MPTRPPAAPIVVVTRSCIAMQIALEVVAEHRRSRSVSDVEEAQKPHRKPKHSSSR